MKRTTKNQFIMYLFSILLAGACSEAPTNRSASDTKPSDLGDNVSVESEQIRRIETAGSKNFREDATIPVNVNFFVDGIRQETSLGLTMATNTLSSFTVRVEGCQSGNFQSTAVDPSIKSAYDSTDSVQFDSAENLIKLIEGDLGCKIKIDKLTFSGQLGSALEFSPSGTPAWDLGERILFTATDDDGAARKIYLKVTSQLPEVITKKESVQFDITTVDVSATDIAIGDSIYQENTLTFSDDSAISISVAGQKMSVNKTGRTIFDFTLKCDAGMVQSDLQCGSDTLSDFKANLMLSNPDGLAADGSAKLALLKDNVDECLTYVDSSTGATGGNPGQSLSVFQADTRGYLDPAAATKIDLSDGGAEVQIRGGRLGAQGKLTSAAAEPTAFSGTVKDKDTIIDGGIVWTIQPRKTRTYADAGAASFADADFLNTEVKLADSLAISIQAGDFTGKDVHGKFKATHTRILGDKKIKSKTEDSKKVLTFEWVDSAEFNISEKGGDSAADGAFIEQSNAVASGITTYTFNNGLIQNDEWSGEVTVKLVHDPKATGDSDDEFTVQIASTDGTSFTAEATHTGAEPETLSKVEFSSDTHDIKATSKFDLANKTGDDPDWKISEATATEATDTSKDDDSDSSTDDSGTLTVKYTAKLMIKGDADYGEAKAVKITTTQDKADKAAAALKLTMIVYANDGTTQLLKFSDDDDDSVLVNTESAFTKSEGLEFGVASKWKIHGLTMVSRASTTDPVSGEATQVSNYSTGKFIQEYKADGTAKTEANLKDVKRTKVGDGSVTHTIEANYADGSGSITFDVVAKTLVDKSDYASSAAATRANSKDYALDELVKVNDDFDAKVTSRSDNSLSSLDYILVLGNKATKKCKAWPVTVSKAGL
jgi:hypothetical protein